MDESCSIQAPSPICIKKKRDDRSRLVKSLTLRGHLMYQSSECRAFCVKGNMKTYYFNVITSTLFAGIIPVRRLPLSANPS